MEKKGEHFSPKRKSAKKKENSRKILFNNLFLKKYKSSFPFQKKELFSERTIGNILGWKQNVTPTRFHDKKNKLLPGPPALVILWLFCLMVEDKKNNSVLFQEEIGKILPHLLAVPQAVSSLLDASTDSYDVVGSHFFVLCEANRIVLDGLFGEYFSFLNFFFLANFQKMNFGFSQLWLKLRSCDVNQSSICFGLTL